MNAVEVGDKITPTPLLDGDLVYCARGRVVWEVATFGDAILLTSEAGARKYINRTLVQYGTLRRVDGSPILAE